MGEETCLATTHKVFNNLKKMMKILTGNDGGWFMPQTDFFQNSNNVDVIRAHAISKTNK